jgi:hypothetical protein
MRQEEAETVGVAVEKQVDEERVWEVWELSELRAENAALQSRVLDLRHLQLPYQTLSY